MMVSYRSPRPHRSPLWADLQIIAVPVLVFAALFVAMLVGSL